MKRVIKAGAGAFFGTPGPYDTGTPKGQQVREDYYSGKYDNVSEGVSDEDAEAKVIEDLAGTEMYLVGRGPDLVFYKPNGMKGTVRLRVARFYIDPADRNYLVFDEEYLTTARGLLRDLENPLIIRSRQEIKNGDF